RLRIGLTRLGTLGRRFGMRLILVTGRRFSRDGDVLRACIGRGFGVFGNEFEGGGLLVAFVVRRGAAGKLAGVGGVRVGTLARLGRGRFGGIAAHHVVAVAARGRAPAMAATMTARAAVDLVVGGALGALLLVDQRLPVGDRDL